MKNKRLAVFEQYFSINVAKREKKHFLFSQPINLETFDVLNFFELLNTIYTASALFHQNYMTWLLNISKDSYFFSSWKYSILYTCAMTLWWICK